MRWQHDGENASLVTADRCMLLVKLLTEYFELLLTVEK